MTIFKSRQVNLDPEPWVDAETGKRLDVGDTLTAILEDRETIDSPRPEFEPTRDSEPWVNTFGNRVRSPGRTDDGEFIWAPRREQFDTPVNRVLVDFRAQWDTCVTARERRDVAFAWKRDTGTGWNPLGATPDEIDHARRVLTRLANWKEQ